MLVVDDVDIPDLACMTEEMDSNSLAYAFHWAGVYLGPLVRNALTSVRWPT